MIWASQVAPGNENGLKLRVYGTRAASNGRRPTRTTSGSRRSASRSSCITRGGAGAGAAAARVTRVPSGHPEGYLEGFANIYAEAARAIRAAGARRAASRRRTCIYPDRRRTAWRASPSSRRA